MSQAATVIPPDQGTGLAVLAPFKTQLAEFKAQNAKLHFDITDEKQRKAAKSHIYSLRQAKAAIDKKRLDEGRDSREYVAKVNDEANGYIDEIEEMIEVHKKPIDEWEAAEEKRVNDLRAVIAGMAINAAMVVTMTSTQLQARVDEISAVVIEPEVFGDLYSEAMEAQRLGVEFLTSAVGAAKKREDEAAELVRLREEAETRRKADEAKAAKEQAEKDEKDRLAREEKDRLQREADAKKAAEEEAARQEKKRLEDEEKERVRVASEAKERERLLKEANDKAEREKQQLIDKAEQERKDAEERQKKAIEDERARVQREADAKAAEDAKREADKAHRGKIHSAIVKGMVATGVTEEQAKAIVIAICGDAIPHIKIIY